MYFLLFLFIFYSINIDCKIIKKLNGIKVFCRIIHSFIFKIFFYILGNIIYVTVIEELLKGLYLDRLGKPIWKKMKDDTENCFESGDSYGGTAFLENLNEISNISSKRITLIGHSAGAVYICNFLNAIKKYENLKGKKFDIIFLAPACTFEMFKKTIDSNKKNIENIRIFGMKDDIETQDSITNLNTQNELVNNISSKIYPYSLLYFVSGLLEEDSDTPLLGMERYYKEDRYNSNQDIQKVKAFLNFGESKNCLFWSKVILELGKKSESLHHGDFDNDKETINSIKHILENGF